MLLARISRSIFVLKCLVSPAPDPFILIVTPKRSDTSCRVWFIIIIIIIIIIIRWKKRRLCRTGGLCTFAHGEEELKSWKALCANKQQASRYRSLEDLPFQSAHLACNNVRVLISLFYRTLLFFARRLEIPDVFTSATSCACMLEPQIDPVARCAQESDGSFYHVCWNPSRRLPYWFLKMTRLEIRWETSSSLWQINYMNAG